MNVKQLKQILKDAPDDAPVLVSGNDHSYWSPRVTLGKAVLEGVCETYQEYWPQVDLGKKDKVLPAILITG